MSGPSPALKLGDNIIATLAYLERIHGQARLLRGDERHRVAARIGLSPPLLVIDVGEGRYATASGAGGMVLVHDLSETP